MTHEGLIAAYNKDQADARRLFHFHKSSTTHLEDAYMELDNDLTYLTYGRNMTECNTTWADNQELYLLRENITEDTLNQIYQTKVKDFLTSIFTTAGQPTPCDTYLLEDYGCHLYDMRFNDLIHYYHNFHVHS